MGKLENGVCTHWALQFKISKQLLAKMQAEKEDDASSISSDEAEPEDFDEQIALIRFKDECWLELSSSSLADDIAELTGYSSNKAESNEGENIVVGCRVRPLRDFDSLDDTPIITSKGVCDRLTDCLIN